MKVPHVSSKSKILKSKQDITKFYQDASVPHKDLMLGIEVERSGVFSDTLKPVNYKDGYSKILKKLVDELGWKIVDKDEKGNIFALKRGQSYLYTETDGRLELASIPRRTLFALSREYRIHDNELNHIAKTFGIRWTSMGCPPFAKINEVKFSPNKRAQFLKRFFLNYNQGHFWLQKTNGIHVNLGFSSENNAIQKFQTLTRIAPILSAMFANSPLNCGRYSGFLCKRINVSQNFAPERVGIRKEFFDENFDFERWVNYVINQPVLYIEKKNQFIDLEGTTFKDYMQKGFKGYYPTKKDYFLHLKSIWTDVRIKRQIEVRSFDTVPPALVLSTAAVVKGLTLNSDVMTAVNKIMEKVSFSDYCNLKDDVSKFGLQADLKGKKVLDYAKELLELASVSLKKHSTTNKFTSRDESRFLWPIKEYIFVREQSPAEYVMEMWKKSWHHNPHKLLEWLEK